ncbi:MAG: hypothetical protein LBM25_03990 [Bacteroidales bacterium]|jgi:tetratricopeptide (TPR) repeat protein|nr:hypothetical protein [Bacteroidales bacterium]
MKRIFYLILVVIVFLSCDNKKNYLRDGNKDFLDKDYKSAEDNYRKAISEDSTYKKASYNLANTIYKENKQDKLPTSLSYYDRAIKQDSIKDTLFTASALYNRANTNFKMALLDTISKGENYNKNLTEAIDHYKKALILNSRDTNAKYNLALAMHLLKQNQNNQNQNKEKNKDNKQNQDKNKQNQDQKQDNKQEKDQKQEQYNQNKSKQDKERMLEALKNNERRTLERVKKEEKKDNKQIKNEKDW